MKIEKVIFSTSEEYSGFWNIQSKIFKLGLGIEPVCLLFGKIANTDMEQTYGKVIEVKLLEDLPKILQITWSKFDYPKNEPETNWLIGDIDMIPLTKRWFLNDKLTTMPEDSYIHMNASGCGSVETWAIKGSCISGGCDLPAHYHVAKGKTFTKAYDLNRSFEDQIKSIVESKKYGIGAQAGWEWDKENEKYFWLAEENYSSDALWVKYKNEEIKFFGFSYDNRNNFNRVDRSAWNSSLNDYTYDIERLRRGDFVDVHCMRYHGTGFATQSWWSKEDGYKSVPNSFKTYEKQNMKLIEESGILR